jgi:uncharacterized Zn-binding protein involved in type VI secretion
MPSVARGQGTDTVFSKTGSGFRCRSSVTTATDKCSPDVFANSICVVREADQVAPHEMAGCDPDESVLTLGAPAVFANFQELARIGDEYTPDNTITSGSSNVFAGNEVPIPANVAGETIDGVFIPENPFQFFHSVAVIRSAGLHAINDEPGEEVVTFGLREKFTPGNESAPADVAPAAVDTGTPTECGSFITSPIDYNQKLSPNFTVRNFSIGAVFAHSIEAQAGFDVAGILCNLKGLAENILEPLSQQYPGFRINSGFRKGAGTSQHNRGQACDLQWPGLAPAGYTPIAEWMRANLPFDQLIFEHGKSIWIHVSYNRTITKQRGAILTYYPPQSPQYRPGLTNYYA